MTARAVYAFRNRKCDRIKLLLYERTGFWLLLRRLEQDHFVWPRHHQTVIELTTDQLHWLLDGIDMVQPLPGSHADASVLATVATTKYVDGMPLYRM
jgi:transposase